MGTTDSRAARRRTGTAHLATARGTLVPLDDAQAAEGQAASLTMAHGTLAQQFGERAAEGQTARLSMSTALVQL